MVMVLMIGPFSDVLGDEIVRRRLIMTQFAGKVKVTSLAKRLHEVEPDLPSGIIGPTS
jgi:hypothetical protein